MVLLGWLGAWQGHLGTVTRLPFPAVPKCRRTCGDTAIHPCTVVASLGLVNVQSTVPLSNNLDFLIRVVGMSVHFISAEEVCGCGEGFSAVLLNVTLGRCPHTYSILGPASTEAHGTGWSDRW